MISLDFTTGFILLIISIIVWMIVDRSPYYDGRKWRSFQYLKIWKGIVHSYFNGKVSVEQKLDNNQQYIFCSFPHGTCKTCYTYD